MIVIDEDGDAKTAHPPTPESPLLGESTPANEPPPAYSYAGHPGNSQPARTASGGVLYYAYGLPNPHPRAEPARRRFIRAFCVAVAVWLLLSFLGQSFVDLAQHEHRSSKPKTRDGLERGETPDNNTDSNDPPPIPSPPRHTTPGCIVGSDGGSIESAKASPLAGRNYFTGSEPSFQTAMNFSFPATSDSLYFNNAGGTPYGYVSIIMAEEEDPERKDVLVDVTIAYHEARTLNRTKVCLEESNNARGIGIYVQDGTHDQLRFDVVIRLPWSSSAAWPLVIPKLTTSFTTFVHHIGDLERFVYFQTLKLKALHTPMEVVSVRAAVASLETSNAPIMGNFSASRSLDLTTSNAVIQAAVALSSDDPEKSALLSLSTSNGPILANISLQSAHAPESGAFSITAATSNAHLALGIADQPPDSRLTLRAATRNAPASVALHPAFAGSFHVASTGLRPVVSVSQEEERPDPAGRGRERTTKVEQRDGHTVEGWAWWGPERERRWANEGSVSVRTSVMPATLKL